VGEKGRTKREPVEKRKKQQGGKEVSGEDAPSKKGNHGQPEKERVQRTNVDLPLGNLGERESLQISGRTSMTIKGQGRMTTAGFKLRGGRTQTERNDSDIRKNGWVLKRGEEIGWPVGNPEKDTNIRPCNLRPGGPRLVLGKKQVTWGWDGKDRGARKMTAKKRENLRKETKKSCRGH